MALWCARHLPAWCSPEGAPGRRVGGLGDYGCGGQPERGTERKKVSHMTLPREAVAGSEPLMGADPTDVIVCVRLAFAVQWNVEDAEAGGRCYSDAQSRRFPGLTLAPQR